MEIVNKVKNILNSMTGLKTVLYQSGFSANVTLDRKETPAAVLYLLTDFDIDIQHGTSKESAELEIFFCDRTRFDITGDQKDAIINNCTDLAKEFISKLLAEKTLYINQDSIHCKCSYGKFDTFVAGVSIELRIEEKQGSCLYIEPEPEPEPEPNEDNTQNEG